MPTMTSTQLDYLRHGEPVGGHRFRGHGIDDPLSETGWRQMRETLSHLAGWQRVVSSPLRRCLAFAEWFAGEHGLPLEVDTDLREVGFGSWEGATRDELIATRRDEYDAFYRDPAKNRPPGAESLVALGRRTAAVFDRLVADYSGEHLLVVAHAGVVRATLGHVTQSPPACWYRASVDNAALTRFVSGPQGVRLVSHNWRPTL